MPIPSINARLARTSGSCSSASGPARGSPSSSTHPKVELVRGEGYLYFVYDDEGPNYETESVMVPYLKHHTDAEWVKMGKDFGDRMTEKIASRGIFGESLPPSGGPFGPFGAHR